MGIDVGQIIEGKYRVTARIGEGGMGAVFAGEHLKLHRKVAIKSIHPAVAQDPEVVTRFEREAQAAGRIGNEHILEVFDIGQLPEGDHYMVMEFLEGEPMNARLTRLQRMPPADVYPLLKQMLQGLAAAHAAGIVHRDLKPANIFILREKAGFADYVKIIDFGISKFQSLGSDASQTRTGTIIGTPAYMSPEQARGLREADARSDIYAVGVIAYEAVTGRVPFEGTSTNDLLFKIFLNEVPPIDTIVSDVDPAFASIVMRSLAKDPNDRFASADEFVAALDAWAHTGRGVTVIKPSVMASTLFEARATGAPVPPTEGAWEGSRAATTGSVAGVPSAGSTKRIVAGAIGIAMSAALVAVAISAFRPASSAAGGDKQATDTATAVHSSASAGPAPTIASLPASSPGVSPVPTTTLENVVTAAAVDASASASASPPSAAHAPAAAAEEPAHHHHHPPPLASPPAHGPPPAHPAVNPLDQL